MAICFPFCLKSNTISSSTPLTHLLTSRSTRTTRCVHLVQHGFAPHTGIIHYCRDHVFYIEVTVANYCDAKISSTDGDERETAIVKSVEKWLRQDTFEVSLEKIPNTDQGLKCSQKRLVAKYRKQRSRSRCDRIAPTALHCIVAPEVSARLLRKRADNVIGSACLSWRISCRLLLNSSQNGFRIPS